MSERSIFLEALEYIDPSRQSAFLDKSCVGDPKLRLRVESLLKSHDEAGSFLGTPIRRSLQTATIGLANTPPAVATVTIFYDTRPARLIGTVSGTGKTTIFSHVSRLPGAGTVGQSGVFAEGVVYASLALGPPIGTETLSWSIEPDTGATATALACLTSVSRAPGSVSTEKDCFRIDGAGNISGGTIFVDKPGIVLNFSR